MRIIKAGMLDTVQDLGRTGYQYLGINVTGAMDKYAAAMANLLAGNEMNEAVLEIHFPGPVILFESTAVIALSGADFQATINAEPVPLNQPVIINKSTILQFHSVKNKSRCYLAVKGGLVLDKWLGSYSTHLNSGAGGFHGHRLQKDDVIEFREPLDYQSLPGDADYKILPWKANDEFEKFSETELLVIPGNEWDWLEESSQEKFLNSPFYISSHSDRMGYRLTGLSLQTKEKKELVSSGVCFGTIQLLPDGQLIILMADSQTTGGYPRLGNIVSAQQSFLAQMKAGNHIRFKFTDLYTAENLLLKQQQHLKQLETVCKLKLENYIHENNRYQLRHGGRNGQ
jgi:antagonist of KipI